MSPPPEHVETTTKCQDIPQPKPKIQDFKVQLHESTIIFPIQETERKSCFLSNLDQRFNYYVSSLHFFSANPDFPPETLVKRLKTAVQKVLVPYDFVAGRVRQNHQLGRLEIDCDATGAGFVVASSGFSIDEIGDLVYPHPGYNQLAVRKLDNYLGPSDHSNQPLCIFQVTSFKCGGFSLGLSTSHLLFDGMGARMFLENLASQAFEDKPLSVIPCNDRHLLVARSPPRVEFPHPELMLPTSTSNDIIPIQEEFEFRIFKLSSNQINFLKEKAKPPPSSTETASTKPPIKITSFNVVAALIWRCKVLSTMDVENDIDHSNRVCTLHSAVDIRPRLNPPLPPSYCGNAVINAYASSKCIELEDKPFSQIVGLISEGVTRVTDEYVKSILDWIEINVKGVPNGDYFITSWWRLGFEQVVYPWGKPICMVPVLNNKKNICCLLPPDNRDVNNNEVNVVVPLHAKDLDRFQSLFYDFFQ